jgi:hypothetical protein
MKKFLVGILAVGALSSCTTGDGTLPDYGYNPDYNKSVIIEYGKYKPNIRFQGKIKQLLSVRLYLIPVRRKVPMNSGMTVSI